TSVDLVESFVTAYNNVMDGIDAQTSTDPADTATAQFSGDPGLQSLQSQLRRLMNSPVTGLTGKYRSLADLGVSTGAIGSAVGTTTDHLTVDEDKLRAALADNPRAVETVLNGFLTHLGAPSGTGNITAVSGTPTGEHESGTYYLKVTDAATRAVEVRFV